MKKYILGFVVFIMFETTSNNTFGQASNLNIWLNATLNNTTTPPQYLNTSFYDYDSLVPYLATPEDVQVSNMNMSSFGGYEIGTSLPYNYAEFTFTGNSDIGIDSGLVLCTGRVPFFYYPSLNSPDSPGAHCGIAHPASFNSTGPNNGHQLDMPFYVLPSQNPRLVQYSDLVALNDNDSIADANVLDFDFVPKGKHIRLQYVFASEEYPENSCASPNDVMGIFLSKKGTPSYENIALVPGTSTPVGIRSIHPSAYNCEGANYPQYYVDNTGGQNVIFDGFTTVLTASATVIPCDTYHLRIAVADGAWHPGSPDSLNYAPNQEQLIPHGMGMYDSGIFLKNQSLRSTEDIRVAAYGGIAGDTATPYAVRGCLNGGFRIYRAMAQTWPLTLHYTLSGTAVLGQDYSPLSDTATIPANATYVDIPVTALTGGTGSRLLQLTLLSPYSTCTSMSASNLGSAVLNIYDNGAYVHITTPDTTICSGCSAQLLVNGDPNLQYSWTPVTGLNNANAQNPIASPAADVHYLMTATPPAPNTCLPAKDSVWVYIGTEGIGKISEKIQISIAPNPFHEIFQILSKQDETGIFNLTLNDLTGRKIMQLTGKLSKINRELSAKTAQLLPGVYFVNVKNENGDSKTFKVVKTE